MLKKQMLNKQPKTYNPNRTVIVQRDNNGKAILTEEKQNNEQKVKEQRLINTKRHFIHNEKMPLSEKLNYLTADNLNSFLIRLIAVILVSIVMYKWLLKNEATIFHFMLILVAWGLVFVPETSRFNLMKHKIDVGKWNVFIQGNMIAYSGGLMVILLHFVMPENPIFESIDKYGIMLLLLLVICFEFFKTNLYEENVFIPATSIFMFSLVESLFLWGYINLMEFGINVIFQYILIVFGPFYMNYLLYRINRNFGFIYCLYGELLLIIFASFL